jgi:tetratricopeptide (TPR) repeat protein
MIEDDYNIETDLAFELQSDGKLDEAIIHYRKSLSLYPYDTTYNNIAMIYEKNKNYKMAKEYYLKAITALSYAPSPHKHELYLYQNMGRFFLYFDNPILAQKYIKQGLSEYPSDAILWLLLSVDDYSQGYRIDATNDVKKAYALNSSEKIKTLYLDILNNRPVDVPIGAFY